MTHSVSRSLVIIGFSLMTVALAASPARSQGAPPPPPAPKKDSAVLLLAPPRGIPVSRFRPSTLPLRQRAPTPAVVIPMTRAVAQPDTLQAASASVATPAPVPPPLQRLAPPPLVARTTAAAATRSLSVAPPPVGATGRCKDGTYLTGSATEQACASHDGLAVVFSAKSQPPRRQ